MKKLAAALVIWVVVMALYTAPADSVMTENGDFDVVLIVKGSKGIKKGKNIIIIEVKDAGGNAVEGAEISVTPWMPMMKHGTPWISKVHDLGRGIYRTNIPLTMGGHWEFRVRVKARGREDTITFDFQEVRE